MIILRRAPLVVRKLALFVFLICAPCALANTGRDEKFFSAQALSQSQNGTGGFEAIVPAPELFCPIISDYHGNLIAVNDPKHGGRIRYASRLTAFGAASSCAPVPVGQAGPDL